MNYRLLLLTHGDAPHLDDVLASFAERVTPEPAEVVCIVDGPGYLPRIAGYPYTFFAGDEQGGFCKATGRAWRMATDRRLVHADYVYWLENDFLHLRPVNLAELAEVLDADPMLAQMQLMRTAVSAEEQDAGGLYESRPGQYVRRGSPFSSPALEEIGSSGVEVAARGPSEWLEHRAYLTTNPSLMRLDFMEQHPWPDYESECEGRFGINLVDAGYRFGVWGSGEPWVRHVGERTGFGY